MNRGENEGILKIKLEHDIEKYLSYNVYKDGQLMGNTTERTYTVECASDVEILSYKVLYARAT